MRRSRLARWINWLMYWSTASRGGASVSFMSPFSHQQALAFFRKVAGSVGSGDAVLLAARLGGRIVGTV
jgi:hypothetical protein